MQVKYVNPFVNATGAIFRTMLELDTTPGTPYLNDYANRKEVYDISGIIGVSGEATGAIVISFPKLTALKIVSVMSGEDVKIFDQTVVDAIGEILNIVTGNAKKDLGGLSINISLPSVITGHQHKLNWPTGVPVVVIPFASSMGKFWMSVCMKTKA